jgi:hypothetical protein
MCTNDCSNFIVDIAHQAQCHQMSISEKSPSKRRQWSFLIHPFHKYGDQCIVIQNHNRLIHPMCGRTKSDIHAYHIFSDWSLFGAQWANDCAILQEALTYQCRNHPDLNIEEAMKTSIVWALIKNMIILYYIYTYYYLLLVILLYHFLEPYFVN